MTDKSRKKLATSRPGPRSGSVVISIDAMGGDNGPEAIVKGLARAAKSHEDLAFIIHGDSEQLTRLLRKSRVFDRCEVVHCAETVAMDDKPSMILRHGQKTSMWSAIEAVREERASVAISCGNTGALGAISMFRLRRLPGISRPAIAALWPSMNPNGYNVVLDVGADVRADENDLLQYARMGASYARHALDLEVPRVGLLNVGTETIKGPPVRRAAYELIEEAAPYGKYKFCGFVEGNAIASEEVDVIVTDGFTGNIALKTGEGTAQLIRTFIKQAFNFNIISKASAIFAIASMRRLRARIDPRRVNGGVFLGLKGTVVKSHGASDATSVAAAISLAYRLSQSGFADQLAARVASVDTSGHDARKHGEQDG